MARAATATKNVPTSPLPLPPAKISRPCWSRASRPSRPQEGQVIKGTIVAIENDFAMVDVGLKTEGRISLKEFAMPGMPADIKVGDTVEVYLERVENALGEAVLSRDKARREESWVKLEKAFNDVDPRHRRDLRPRQGRLHRRSRRRRGLPARFARSMCARCAMSAR